MVNVKNLFGMAVMASALVACSSNDDVNPNPNPQGGDVVYAAFKINLPSTNGTRANDVNSYEKGDAKEYGVSAASFYVFTKGNSDNEADYTFLESTSVNLNGEWTESTVEGITTSKKLIARLNSVSKTGNYKVLVVLNKPTGFKEPMVGQTFSNWNNSNVLQPQVSDWTGDNKFYMTNATLVNSGNVTTLTTVTANNIYSTKEAAESGSAAAEVYVERGVAKIDVAKPSDNIEVKDKDTKAANGDKVNFTGWGLDITNKKTYAVHNVTGLASGWANIWSSERMLGDQNRVFWGIDPNYDDNALKGIDDNNAKLQENFNFIADAEVNEPFGPSNSKYCFENTFDINNMYQGQTTRVVFKAKYTPTTDHADEDGTFYHLGSSVDNITSAQLKTAIEDAAKAELGSAFKSVELGDISAKGGVHFIELANIKADNSGTEETLVADHNYNGKTGSEIVDAVNNRLGLKKATREEDNVGINTYAKGVTYYIARVRHFYDPYCGWKSGDPTYESAEKHLGRYGMLRNNWYELTIGNVYGPGYPGVPPVNPDEPDDENENYLSVSVKILSWAKRSQTVDL